MMTTERARVELSPAGDLRGRNFAAALHFLRNPADAEDAIQDACLAAWQYRASFNERCGFQFWFSRILINCCRTQIRARNRRPEISLNQLTEGGGFQPVAEDDPAEREALRELVSRVRSEVRALPPFYRNILTPLYFEEMPMGAIGARLGISYSAAKSRSVRAYAELRMRWNGKQ